MKVAAVERAARAAIEASGAAMGAGVLVVEFRPPDDAALAAALARRVLVRLESAGARGLPLALMRTDPGTALLEASSDTVVVLLVDATPAMVEGVGEVLAELEWTGIIVGSPRVVAQAAGLGFVPAATAPASRVRVVVERDLGTVGEVEAPAIVVSAGRGVGRIAARRAIRRLVVGTSDDVRELVGWLKRDATTVVGSRLAAEASRRLRRWGIGAGSR